MIIPDMQGFLHGSASFGPEAQYLRPQIKADLCDWWSKMPKEVILTGGMGWGKTYMMEWMARRLVFEWSDPNFKIKTKVGGKEDYPVSILWIEREKAMAVEVVNRMENFLKQGRWWKENGVKWERDSDYSLVFENGLVFEAAFDLTAIVGLRYAAYFNNFDIHFMDRKKAVEHLRRAQENLLHVCNGTPQPEARFLQHGMFAVASSIRDVDDVLAVRMQWVASEVRGMWGRAYKKWDVEDPYKYTDYFHVLLVSRRNASQDIEIVVDFSQKWGLGTTENGRTVLGIVPVPKEYLPMFIDKPQESLRDLAGILWGD